jgi:hypothetical protein
MRDATVGLELLCCRTALRFDCLVHLVEACEREYIAIDVLKAGKHLSPNRRLVAMRNRRIAMPACGCLFVIPDSPEPRCVPKANSTRAPFRVGACNIFYEKHHPRRSANQLVIGGLGVRLDKRQHCGSIVRCDPDTTLTRLEVRVKSQLESELLNVKLQTAFLVANEYIDRMKPQIINGGLAAIVPGLSPRNAHGGD